MERLWTMIPLAAVLSVGCVGMSKSWLAPVEDLSHQVQKAVGLEKPQQPATQFACTLANRLQQLPDPTHGGRMTAGLVGQVFLYGPDDLPSDIQGELTVMVSDASTQIKAPHTPEVWHFTAETLRKMVINDDRYGRSLAIFLPWPAEWNDVNRVAVQARYDQPNLPPLYSLETKLTLDLSTSAGASAGGVVQSMTTSQAEVPNPAVALKAMQMQPPVAVPAPAIVPVAATVPAPPGEFQRTVIPRK